MDNVTKLETKFEERRYVEFTMGDQFFSIPLLTIKEVVPVPDTTPLPEAPPYMLGLMNLRGTVLPVIDLRKKLGIKKLDDNSQEAVIIVEIANTNFGLVVDSINKVIHVAADDFSESDQMNTQLNSKFTAGVIKHDKKLIVALDLEKLLDADKIHARKKKLNN